MRARAFNTDARTDNQNNNRIVLRTDNTCLYLGELYGNPYKQSTVVICRVIEEINGSRKYSLLSLSLSIHTRILDNLVRW